MSKIYAKNGFPTRGILNCLAAFTLFWLAPALSMAQVTSYSFSRTQVTYTPVNLTGAEVLLQNPNGDDNNFTIPIGFTFRFNGVDYTQVTVSNNGTVVFGTTGYGYTQIADNTGAPQLGDVFDVPANSTIPAGAAACAVPFALDIRMDADSKLGAQVAGTAPNRTLTVQWEHERRFDSPDGTDDDFNFQAVLREGSNVIEFNYGLFSFTSNGFEPQVGIRGQDATGADFINVAAQSGGGFASANRSTSKTDRIVISSSADLPASGTQFRFAPIPPAPNDLGVIAFASPRTDQTSCLLSSTEAIRVVVRNYGSLPQTSAPISYQLNNGTVVTGNFTFSPSPLQPNSTDTITLAATANLSVVGTYNFRAYTTLANEPLANRSNDSSAFSITLTGPVAPPALPLGTLAEATSAQWKEAQGTTLPTGTTSNWATGFPFVSESIALVFDATGANARNNEWLLSPNYNIPSANFFLIFKSYVTKEAFGGTQITNIGDDTVKLMISTDCGSTWRSLRKFSQADVAAGRIDNDPNREFRFPLVANPSSVRIAFFGTSNNTPAPATAIWRFHVDDIEFKEVIPTDLGVTRVLAPLSGQPGCLLGPSEIVTVVVKNFGSAIQTQSDVAYRVQSASGLSAEKSQLFSFNPPLIPGNEDTVTFSVANGADLSTAGTYRIIAYSKLVGETANTRRNDTAKSNDVLVSAPYSLPAPIITGLFVGNTAGWTRGRGISQPTGGISNWSFSAGSVGSEFIGMPFTATAAVPLREWWYSPSYAGTAFTTVTFKAAVLTANSVAPAPNGMEDDTVFLKVSNDCGSSWRTIRKFSQADVAARRITNVLQEFTALVPSVGTRISFGFFADNNGTASITSYRFVLDDVKIKNALQDDQGVIAATAPTTNLGQCTQTCAQPTVVVRNYGAAPQTSATVSYRVNGGAPKTEIFALSPALAPSSADTLTFSVANCADLSQPGTYVFRFYTTTAGEDADSRLNDTLRNYTVVTLAAVPVAGSGSVLEDFENEPAALPVGWQAERNQPSLDWVNTIGRGAGPVNSPSDGFGAWMLPQNPYSWAVSPRYSLPNTPGTSLQFDFRIVESARGTATIMGQNDSVLIEATTTCGNSWQRIGLINQSNQIVANWHTTQTFPLDAFLGQETSFRLQVWMRRIDQTGAYVDIDNWRLGAPVATKASIANLGYSLMPNPARDRVALKGPAGKAAVTVISSLGQKVMTATLTDGKADLSLNALAPGMYRVLIAPEKGNQSQVLTLIKE